MSNKSKTALKPETADKRFTFTRVAGDEETFAEAVLNGLSAEEKSLPCRFFYDEHGSHLFEKITDLPEYYLTRAEQEVLCMYSGEIVTGFDAQPLEIVELGSGSSRKTRTLLESAGDSCESVTYIPIDISERFLMESCQRLLHVVPSLQVRAIAGTYDAALVALDKTDVPRLFVLFGSTIGNMELDDAVKLLLKMRGGMNPQSRILLGADLLKDVSIIESAYNDASGVTAEFNKNILSRINRELGGTFDIGAFEHSAAFLPGRSRIEMRLVSRSPQFACVGAIDKIFSFGKGEAIHTENCHKYTLDSLEELAEKASMRIENAWTDERKLFADVLLAPIL